MGTASTGVVHTTGAQSGPRAPIMTITPTVAGIAQPKSAGSGNICQLDC